MVRIRRSLNKDGLKKECINFKTNIYSLKSIESFLNNISKAKTN